MLSTANIFCEFHVKCVRLHLLSEQNSTAADNGLDDGEIDKVEFDASKFIEYPGFNAPTPMNLIDVRPCQLNQTQTKIEIIFAYFFFQ